MAAGAAFLKEAEEDNGLTRPLKRLFELLPKHPLPDQVQLGLSAVARNANTESPGSP
jgi:hypothetical protein